MAQWTKDYISIETAKHLVGLLRERARRSPTKLAYRYYERNSQTWKDLNWYEVEQAVTLCERRLAAENFSPGDCVAIMAPNCPTWVVFEQAAMRLGLVVVPLFPNDRPDNVAYICNDAAVKMVLVNNGAQWQIFRDARNNIQSPPKILSILPVSENSSVYPSVSYDEWLKQPTANVPNIKIDPMQLATIVYTSGTTGKPKGVMLSHHNILTNAFYGINSVDVYFEDLFLSFLPLSHTLERTVGYYIPMMTGAAVAFSRSIPELADDLLTIKPTVLISVPRIFERVYGKIRAQLEEKSPVAQTLFRLAVSVGYQRFEVQQGRRSPTLSLLLWPLLNALVARKIMAKLGGRMRFSISGGAALSKTVAETFIGLGLPILQGYGLTEASPVISVNRMDDNVPESIGLALPNIDTRLGTDGELQTRSTCVMMGYWKNESATRDCFTSDGWLRTGDLAKIDAQGHITIIGRVKDILVLSNGEKVPPDDAQMAITLDPLFEQALVLGEAKPYLTAIVVVAQAEWDKFAKSLQINEADKNSLSDPLVIDAVLQRINRCMTAFPGYAQIRNVTLTLDPWTDANGLLTPSLKIKRKPVMEKFKNEIDAMYEGH